MTSGCLLSLGSPMTRQQGELGQATGCGLSVTHAVWLVNHALQSSVSARGCRQGAGPSELKGGCENIISILRMPPASHSHWLVNQRYVNICN